MWTTQFNYELVYYFNLLQTNKFSTIATISPDVSGDVVLDSRYAENDTIKLRLIAEMELTSIDTLVTEISLYKQTKERTDNITDIFLWRLRLQTAHS